MKASDFLKNKSASWAISVLSCVVIWAFLSYLPGAKGYIPSPSNVANAFWFDKFALCSQFYSTFKSALLGFFFGLFFAVCITLVVVFNEGTRRFFSILAVIIYSVPLIAAAPLATLLFTADKAGIVLGCIGAFLPIFLTGLKYGDRISNNFHTMFLGFGGSKKSEIKLIRLPLTARGWVIGSQSGWMWAVLGALLGDFAGNNWGLGTFLIGSISQGNPSKIWVIVLLCLFMSGIGLLIIREVAKRFRLHGSYDPLDIPAANTPNKLWSHGFLQNALWFSLFLLIWQGISWILKIEGGIFAGPIEVVSVLLQILHGNSALSSKTLLFSLEHTWFLSMVGVVISLILAFLLAASRMLIPTISRPIVIVMLIAQVTPIVAFVPLIAFYLGRGSSSILAIVILSTIYPAHTVFKKSFEEVSKNAIEIVRGFGASSLFIFFKVQLPYAAWAILVALRLAIGRAILGAITAEYLLTGTGLGGLLGQTRAQLDFTFVWFICVLVAFVTIATDILCVSFKNLLQKLLRRGDFFVDF